ncbi:MAG: HI0074 family nucleotidyltransferase substrate-binding subunit [Myxococcales bacterium]
MSGDAAQLSFRALGQAIERLREALSEPLSNPLAIDGTLQRFEFTLGLYWKVLHRLLAQQGVQTGTPREALRKAYAAGWLADETLWLQLLEDRNATSHAYDEAAARRIYDRIRAAFPALAATYRDLGRRFGWE